MKVKKLAKILFRIVISLSLVIYLLNTQNYTQIFNTVKLANPYFFTFAFTFLIFGTIISAFRWSLILKTSNFNVSPRLLFILYLKGYFYNNFLPTQMGGDFYKAISLSVVIKDKSVSVFSVFMDRFCGLLVLLVMSLFGISYFFGVKYLVLAFSVFIFGLIFYFPSLKFLSKRSKFLNKFYKASVLLVKNKKIGVLILLYSFFVQICSFVVAYLLFLSLNISIPLGFVFAFMPLTSLSLLIPSFNGFGTQDVIYSTLFGFLGVTSVISLAVSVLLHTVRLLMSLIGGILIFFKF